MFYIQFYIVKYYLLINKFFGSGSFESSAVTTAHRHPCQHRCAKPG